MRTKLFRKKKKVTVTSISATPATTNSTAIHLTHLQHQWPGQKNGKRQHLDVRPMSFETLLSRNHKILIPLFQRRYCWTRTQIQQWWKDVVYNSATRTGNHSTHKTMFKREYNDVTKETSLICIDGQQRLTTIILLLTALRGEGRRANNVDLISKIDNILFPNPDAFAGLKRWSKYQAVRLIRNNDTTNETNNTGDEHNDNEHKYNMPAIPSGWLPLFDTILSPSYIDRAAYYETLCYDYVLQALEVALLIKNTNKNDIDRNIQFKLNFSAECCDSAQYTAYNIFQTEIQRLVTSSSLSSSSSAAAGRSSAYRAIRLRSADCNQTPSSSSPLSRLNKLLSNQLDGFSMMYIELLTDENVQEIFLWMQEKSVFGMGKLLVNNHPGIDFTPVDLARNLVASVTMNEPLENQVEFYQQLWINQFEKRFGTHNLSLILYQLVAEKQQSQGHHSRYVGEMERTLLQYKLMTPVMLRDVYADNSPMMVYGKFHSYVQEQAKIISENNDPNAITKQVGEYIIKEMIIVGERMGL